MTTQAMRVKQESWQAVESSLSERALRAESAAEMADHRKALLEEQVRQYIPSINPINASSTHPINIPFYTLSQTPSHIPPTHTHIHPRLHPLGGGNEAASESIRRSTIRSTSLFVNQRWYR